MTEIGGKKLLFENEGVGIVQFELSNEQVPCENLAAQLEIRKREKRERTSCLESRRALRRIPATLGVSWAQMASKMVDMALSNRTALEMSSFGF